MPELIEYLEDGCSLEAVPHTYGCVKVRDTFTIPNTYGFDFPTDFGSTSAADTYFHAVDDGANTYFFPPAVGQPSTPTLATNVAGIQAFLTSIGSGITYTINAFNEIVLTYANPGDENIWSFWMGTSNSSDSWNNKTTPTLHDLRTDSVIYKSVQVVKLKNQDGTYIDKYYLPSTTSNLAEIVLDTFDTFNFGECRECKKEIFATHQRYYVTSGVGIPSNYVAYWLGQTMEVWLGQTGADTSNCFIHATHGILNGVADGGVGTDLISPFAGTTPGIPLTNVSLVQSMTNISAANMGLSSTDLIYAITNDNQPVWFLSPAAIALLPNNTYLHPYMYFTDTPGTYNKCDINVIAPYTIGDVKQTSAPSTQTTCTPIQEIKEKDSCTEKLSYRYILENGNGLLVEASTLISNFDETNVKLSCPEVNFLEKEVCGTINGSTNTYELIRIYTRDATTGNITLLHYEDNFGTIVTGVVVEVCCDCNTLCSVAPMPLLNRACFGYNGSFNGDYQFPADKANIGADIFIEYFEVDGNILINTSTSIGSTGTATFSDMGYGIAYDNIVKLINANSLFYQNDIKFVTAGNVLADRGWGVEYNDTKSYRIVIRDFIPNSGASATWTIVINPTEQWEGIGNGSIGGNWTLIDFSNNVGITAKPFNGCIAI